MKKRAMWIVVITALFVLGMLLYPRRKPSRPPADASPAARAPQSTPAQGARASANAQDGRTPPAGVRGQQTTPEQERESYLQTMLRELMKPIEFYGRVIDHEGRPVADAYVTYSANNNPDPTGSGSRGQTTSDANGAFTIRTHGISLYVEVSKEGYYRTPEINGQRGSYGGFANHDKPGNADVPMPLRNAPAVFVLRKIGTAVPLIASGEKSIRVPRNGTPTEISIATGQKAPAGEGDLRVEAWTDDANADAKGRYDWRCRLTIPGGGLVERTGQFDFEAPVEGYAPAIELVQSRTAERWRPSLAKQFFVRLVDDHYARINFEMIAGGDHFVVLESFLNPKAGDRNLEFDPAKAIPPKP